MTLNEPLTSFPRGEFWLPEAPERRISGAAEFVPTPPGRLVLDGELSPGLGPVPLVYGSLFDGRRLTAIDCHAAGLRTIIRSDEHVRQTIDVRTFLIGEHLNQRPKFDQLGVHLTSLREWAHVRQGWQLADGWASPYSIRYEGPPERTATLDDGRIVMLRTVDHLTTATSRIHGEQETLFNVTFPKPASLEDIGKAVASLQNMVTFAVRKPAKVIGLSVTCPGVFIAPGADVQLELELRNFQLALAPTGDVSTVDSPDRGFLFRAPDSSSAFGALVQRWVDLERQLGVVLDVFLSLLYAPPHHLENQVMNVCQAAEGYHRRVLDHEVMPPEEYEALKATLETACPEPWRKWLSGLLAHANGPSFKVRIEELVAKSGAVGTTLTSTFENYPGKLRNCRDRFAHWHRATPTPIAQVPELADLSDTTKILLEACLLLDLGWTADNVTAALAGKRDFERLARRPSVVRST
jgi:hypothetical protein